MSFTVEAQTTAISVIKIMFDNSNSTKEHISILKSQLNSHNIRDGYSRYFKLNDNIELL